MISTCNGDGETTQKGGRTSSLQHTLPLPLMVFFYVMYTIKTSFSPNELSSIAGPDHFAWRWDPASGHSGGILVGASLDVFDVVAF